MKARSYAACPVIETWHLPSAGIGFASCRGASWPATFLRPSTRPLGRNRCSGRRCQPLNSRSITFTARSRASSCEFASADQRRQHLEALFAHHEQIGIWAENCPENFENRAALVGAEIARIEGRVLDAEHLYEQAIRSARDNNFVHNEALAYELAARFYAGRGFEEVSHIYLGNARRRYLRWGADGKVRQLDQLYPHLRQDERLPGPTGTIQASVEQLDLATVIEASQGLSGEMVLEKLIDKLMRAALEHAGAERGLLIVPRDEVLQIEAEAFASGDHVTVHLPCPDAAASFPES